MSFGEDLARNATAIAVRRDDDIRHPIDLLIDGDQNTYFATHTGKETLITIAFKKQVTIENVVISEAIPLGQRECYIEISYPWYFYLPEQIAKGTTIGHKRIFHFSPVTTDQLWIRFGNTIGGPHAISSIEVFGPSQR